MKTLLVLLVLLTSALSQYYPPLFDVRFQYQYRDCDWSITEEGLCVGNWAIIVSEVVGTQYCVSGKAKGVKLSSQELLDCVVSSEEKCQTFLDKANLQKAFDYVSTNGLRTSSCYPYTSLLSGENDQCSSTCKGSSNDTQTYKASFNILGSINSVKEQLMNNGPVIMLIETFDEMLHQNVRNHLGKHIDFHLSDVDHVLGYRALKLVGWQYDKTLNKEFWVAGNSWGDNWSMVGYTNLLMNDVHILSYYGVTV